MPAMTDTIKVEITSVILSLPSAGENRSFFIMHEIDSGVNESAFCFLCFCTRCLLLLLRGVIIGVQKVMRL